MLNFFISPRPVKIASRHWQCTPYNVWRLSPGFPTLCLNPVTWLSNLAPKPISWPSIWLPKHIPWLSNLHLSLTLDLWEYKEKNSPPPPPIIINNKTQNNIQSEILFFFFIIILSFLFSSFLEVGSVKISRWREKRVKLGNKHWLRKKKTYVLRCSVKERRGLTWKGKNWRHKRWAFLFFCWHVPEGKGGNHVQLSRIWKTQVVACSF